MIFPWESVFFISVFGYRSIVRCIQHIVQCTFLHLFKIRIDNYSATIQERRTSKLSKKSILDSVAKDAPGYPLRTEEVFQYQYYRDKRYRNTNLPWPDKNGLNLPAVEVQKWSELSGRNCSNKAREVIDCYWQWQHGREQFDWRGQAKRTRKRGGVFDKNTIESFP